MQLPSASVQPLEAFCQASRLSYLEAGEGDDAVVLLHGWGAFKELWWSTIVALAPYVHVFAPDLPGHSGSPIDGASNMRQVADRIARFCEQRDLRKITLAGHSMGGNVAVELVLAHPDLVQRLVLVDPALQMQEMPAYTRSYLDAARGWAALRAHMAFGQRLKVIAQLIPHAHRGGMFWPTVRRTAYLGGHDANALRLLLANLAANPMLERLSDIRIPTLVISGEFDLVVPPALSRRVAQAIPGARFEILPGAAHNPMDERPQDFAQLLRSFLGCLPDPYC